MSESIINPHGLDLGKTLLGQKMKLASELAEAQAEVARLRDKEAALMAFLETVPDGTVPASTIDKICGILYGRLELARAALSPQAQEG